MCARSQIGLSGHELGWHCILMVVETLMQRSKKYMLYTVGRCDDIDYPPKISSPQMFYPE